MRLKALIGSMALGVLCLAGSTARSATITVSSSAGSSGAGTFRGSVGAATAGDIIAFNPGIFTSGSTIVMAGTATLGVNMTIDVSGAPLLTISSSNIALATGVTGTFDVNSGNTLSIQSVVDGLGALTKAGLGNLTLSGVNLYSGGTSLNGGALQVSNDNNLGSGTLTFNGGKLLTLAGISSAKGINLAGAGSFDSNGFDSTLSGVIGGTGALTKVGAGTLTLSGTNTYSGGTLINGGTVSVGSDSNLGTGFIGFDGGTLQTSAGISSAKSVTLAAGGGTFDSNGFNSSLSGVISGGGAFTKIGTGTLTLGGSNTYTGLTDIQAGVLTLGTSNALSVTGALSVGAAGTFNLAANNQTLGSMTGSGSVQLGSGTLTLNNASSVLFTGVIAGTGHLTKAGTGTLTLSASNTYSGGTLIAAGTLQAASDSNLGTGNITFTGGTLQYLAGFNSAKDINLAGIGTMDTNGFFTVTLSGAISGAGALTKTGAGVVALLGSNSYSGGTGFNGGTVIVATEASLGTGDLTFNGGTLATLLSSSSSKNIQLLAGGGTLNVVGDLAVSGVIAGSGTLQKQGIGTLTLNGANVYSGTTTISTGTLLVGDSVTAGAALLGDVAVNAGATLGGYGMISGTVTNNGTVQAAGFSGTLSINTLTQNAGGTFTAGIAPGNMNSSRLLLTNANLDGRVMVVSAPGAYGIRQRYTILSSVNAISGTFAGGVSSDQSYMDPSLVYGAKDATLVMTRNNADFSAFGQTTNEKAVGAALNGSVKASMDDALADKLNLLYLLGPGQEEALRTMGGSTYASLSTVMLADNRSMDLLLAQGAGSTTAPFNGRFGTPAAPAPVKATSSKKKAGAPKPGREPIDLWVQGIFGSSALTGDGNAEGYTGSRSGFMFGGDGPLLKGFTTGLAIGTNHASLASTSADPAKTEVDSMQLGLYGGRQKGAWDFSGALQFATDKYQSKRTIVIGSDVSQATSSFGGGALSAGFKASYAFPLKQLTLSPLAGLQYSSLSVDAFTEKGADTLNLDVAAQSYSSIRPMAGLALSRIFKIGRRATLNSDFSATLSQELSDLSPQAQASLAGDPGSHFTVKGVKPDATQFALGAGLGYLLGKSFNVSLNYSGTLGAAQSQHGVGLGAGYSF